MQAINSYQAVIKLFLQQKHCLPLISMQMQGSQHKYSLFKDVLDGI